MCPVQPPKDERKCPGKYAFQRFDVHVPRSLQISVPDASSSSESDQGRRPSAKIRSSSASERSPSASDFQCCHNLAVLLPAFRSWPRLSGDPVDSAQLLCGRTRGFIQGRPPGGVAPNEMRGQAPAPAPGKKLALLGCPLGNLKTLRPCYGCNPIHTFVGVRCIEHNETYFGVDVQRTPPLRVLFLYNVLFLSLIHVYRQKTSSYKMTKNNSI